MALVLHPTIGQFSWQVYTPTDHRFWFRLVREGDRDLITDFFLGAFPKDESGALLAACYRTLDLTPGRIIVFRDILSGRDPGPGLIEAARQFYTEAGSGLLTEFGRPGAEFQVEERRDKIDLALRPERKT